jgi:hypothetical protein
MKVQAESFPGSQKGEDREGNQKLLALDRT